MLEGVDVTLASRGRLGNSRNKKETGVIRLFCDELHGPGGMVSCYSC